MDRHLLVAFFSLFAATHIMLHAQGSVWGTDFVVSYGPVLGAVQSDSVYLYIVSSSAGQCSVSLTTCDTEQIISMMIPVGDPRKSVRVGIPVAVLGHPIRKASCGVIRIRSDLPIGVLAFVHDSAKGEAATVLPVSSAGRTYVVPTALPLVGADSIEATSLRASIVAPGSTEVIISSGDVSLRINGTVHPPQQQSRFLLNANEQCLIEVDGAVGSRSGQGLVIHASQPVMVFWGGRWGKNILYEQLLAAEYWEQDYVIPQFPSPVGELSESNGYAIITAIADGTTVQAGQDTLVLNASESATIPLRAALVVESTHPITILAVRDGGHSAIGAQCAMLIPPLSGSLPAMTVISPQFRYGIFRMYTEQYLTVVSRQMSPALILDGAPWVSVWDNVGSKPFVVSLRRVGDDIHILENRAAGGFLSWIVGYGERRAYATTGDFRVHPFPYLFARFILNSDTIATTDTFSLRVSLAQLTLPPPLMRMSPPVRVRFQLRWNATVATPLERSLQLSIRNGAHVEWCDVELPAESLLGSDYVLVEKRLIAALGELAAFKVEIDSVLWLDKEGQPIAARYVQEGGYFTFRDIWRDQWGARLVSPMAGNLSLQVIPNPVEMQAVILVSVPKGMEPATLELYDMMGQKVRVLLPSMSELERGQMLFVRGDLSSGAYFLRLVYREYSLVVPVVLQ
ncbi:MAG: T9SS type A sorting domain-containing protein [Bacteroidota bacterium]|nr:T9SS type A sorting domain-containing protein [Candidatus Kapabacteria bacterium]MDW8270961.1 T9SS type A sorting domain-containing protein [Bacteroidota bacterium]